jgi:hypothetical protein
VRDSIKLGGFTRFKKDFLDKMREMMRQAFDKQSATVIFIVFFFPQ